MYGTEKAKKLKEKSSENWKQNNPMYNPLIKEKHRIIKTKQNRDLKIRKKNSEGCIGRIPWNKGMRGWLILSEEARRKMSLAKKGKKLSEEQISKFVKSMHSRPNKAESRLNDLLQEILPNEYKYIGSGDIIIGGKAPDFININGKKKLIEFFGEYWHKDENPEDRINLFKRFGFDTLIVWGRELKHKDNVSKKIMEFHNM